MNLQCNDSCKKKSLITHQSFFSSGFDHSLARILLELADGTKYIPLVIEPRFLSTKVFACLFFVTKTILPTRSPEKRLNFIK